MFSSGRSPTQRSRGLQDSRDRQGRAAQGSGRVPQLAAPLWVARHRIAEAEAQLLEAICAERPGLPGLREWHQGNLPPVLAPPTKGRAYLSNIRELVGCGGPHWTISPGHVGIRDGGVRGHAIGVGRPHSCQFNLQPKRRHPGQWATRLCVMMARQRRHPV